MSYRMIISKRIADDLIAQGFKVQEMRNGASGDDIYCFSNSTGLDPILKGIRQRIYNELHDNDFVTM